MLKKRLIPKLLIRNRTVGNAIRPVLVTTVGFTESISVGDPISQAKIYEAQLADELVVLNIDGIELRKNASLLKLIERLASETFMPLTVGGGVRSIEDFEALLHCGADKVCINTSAIRSPALIHDAANRFGAQCVVVSVDFRTDAVGNAVVMINHARDSTSLRVKEWVETAVRAGAGEILLTDADRDGAGSGLNCEVAREVVSSIDVPVVISGGCGTAEHFVRGFLDGGVEGVAAGTYFCFRDQNPMQTRSHIKNSGIPIRMET